MPEDLFGFRDFEFDIEEDEEEDALAIRWFCLAEKEGRDCRNGGICLRLIRKERRFWVCEDLTFIDEPDSTDAKPIERNT